MLGRLRMSVTEAIAKYGILSEKVFSDVKLMSGEGKFKASKLRDVVWEIVEERTGQADERMMDTREGGDVCKTYVAKIPQMYYYKADPSAGLSARWPP